MRGVLGQFWLYIEVKINLGMFGPTDGGYNHIYLSIYLFIYIYQRGQNYYKTNYLQK